MTFRKMINEQFNTYVKVSYGPTAPVYTNPTLDEVIDCTKFDNASAISLTKSVKFIIDLLGKKVIVFPGFIIHNTVWRHLGKAGYAGVNPKGDTNPNLFCGEARSDGGKLRFIESDVISRYPEVLDKMKEKDWSFADKYFTQPVNDIVKNYSSKRSKIESYAEFKKNGTIK